MSDGPATPADPRPEEILFQQSLTRIGGQERIYLVSDVTSSKEKVEGDVGVLRDFITDMFHGDRACPTKGLRCDPRDPNACAKRQDLKTTPAGEEVTPRRTATQEVNVHSRRRAIDSPLVVFIFRQKFVGTERACVKEILKDVRARARRRKRRRPALVGLVHSEAEDADTGRCVEQLEMLVRSVFHKHLPETIWVGGFTPNTEANTLDIKRNISRVIKSSQEADNTEDRGSSLSWPFSCVCLTRGADGPPSQEPRDDMQSAEESIPLKIQSSAAGHQEESAGVDS